MNWPQKTVYNINEYPQAACLLPLVRKRFSAMDKLISIHDLKENLCKKYYGSARKVYRQCDMNNLLRMWSDLNHLTELYERTRFVPFNPDFKYKKAIPIYNAHLSVMHKKYPNILEFQKMRHV